VVTILLFVHLLLAVTLLGAVTHQAVSVWHAAPAGPPSFIGGYRAVRGAVYTNAIVILYVVVIVMGGIIYPAFRNHVSPELVRLNMTSFQGWFDLKEHTAALGFGTLAVYWYFWKVVPLDQGVRTRALLTTLIASCVWFAFLMGHMLNNIKGFGS
jgi:hypothetical protein